MIIRAYGRLGGKPIVEEVTMLVVENDQGTPIVIASDYGNGAVSAEIAVPERMDRFRRMLAAMGIDRTFISTNAMHLKKPGDLPVIQ